MSGIDRPAPATLVGSSSTWYCMVWPPNEDRSATPGTDLYALATTQSCRVLSSMGVVGAGQDVAIDQTRGGKQRRHIGVDPIRHLDSAQALEHPLPREVVVGAVLEHQPHVGEPVERDRPHHLELREAVHLGLDRHRDEALDLFGGVARPLADDCLLYTSDA